MVLFNYATRELTAKIVYYGPGLCGKTTNLENIHKNLPEKSRGKMLSLATQTDRTLFFDFLPIDLGSVKGMKTRVQLYTVPGQVFYDATRKLVLKGADGVVFVADSQKEMLQSNLDSWENLRTNLHENGLDIKTIPLLIQYNKRDLPNVMAVKELNKKINENNVPTVEAIAIKGKGVQETLKGIAKLVLESLSTRFTKDTREGLREEKDEAGSNSKSSLSTVVDDAEELVEDLPGPDSPTPAPGSLEEFEELEELNEFPETGEMPKPEILKALHAEAQREKAAKEEKPAPSKEKKPNMMETYVTPPVPSAHSVITSKPRPLREDEEESVVISPSPAAISPKKTTTPAPSVEPARVQVPAAAAGHDIQVPVEVTVGSGEQVVRLQISINLKINLVPK